MLPQNTIVAFWGTVTDELVNGHKLSKESAGVAISAYRSALDRHQVGDLVYHRDPESVADTIAAGWIRGFPDPKPSPS
jgi:hypothetical protein